jgi:hypothetical protein
MDKLKDFIEQHREEFDNETLPEGHLERFERKLHKREGAIRRFILPAAATIAAACFLAFFFLPGKEKGTDPAGASAFVCEAGDEMDALREYYNMRVYDVEEQIKSLHDSSPSPGSLELVEESGKVVQTVYEFEENILPTLPCTDNGLFAMTQQYANSLESLNFMLGQMEQITDGEYSIN